MEKPLSLQATVLSITKLSSHVYQYIFTVLTPLQFSPGQYATFLIDEQTRRQYSFAAPSLGANQFTIVLDVTPMGPGSKFFLDKKVGDTVTVLAPLGTFHLDTPITPVVFVATGTGLVPFRTMIEEYLTSGGKQKINLYWGLRHEEDIFWEELLTTWQLTYSNFRYHIVLSKPTNAWNGLQGHVTEHVFEEKHLEENDFYLCGKREMVREVEDQLLAKNVPKEQIRTELF